jgi:hypothetical protein
MTIYDISGKVSVKTTDGETILRENFVSKLRSLHATVNVSEDGSVTFQRPRPWPYPWVHQWHFLAPISSGQVEFMWNNSHELEVFYKASLFRIRLVCLLMTLGWVFITIYYTFQYPPFNIFPLLLGTTWIWAFGYGLSWFIASIRFRSFIDRMCQKI